MMLYPTIGLGLLGLASLCPKALIRGYYKSGPCLGPTRDALMIMTIAALMWPILLVAAIKALR